MPAASTFLRTKGLSSGNIPQGRRTGLVQGKSQDQQEDGRCLGYMEIDAQS